MHASVTRLFDYATRATHGQDGPVLTMPDLQVRLEISSATLTNWKSRGVSKEGAIKAEREFGCSVNWVLTGEGAEDAVPRDDSVHRNRASSPTSDARKGRAGPSLTDSLAVLGAHLVRSDDLTRIQVASLLDTWIRHPERNEEIGRRIIGLLQESTQRPSAPAVTKEKQR